MSININTEIQELNELGLLEGLLKDKTSGDNIIWASDLYSQFGPAYTKESQIRPELIAGTGVISTRFDRDNEDQSNRTKRHAEVFTPLWICNRMNNELDDDWFGRCGAFNNGKNRSDTVVFPEGRKWTDYVDSRRLEITCGEAPFLVSRYDITTGRCIPVPERIGQLDRKLRVVSENAKTEEDWLKWAFRAFEATYGYEFQGDNLLIARINLLKTFEDYLLYYWDRKPTIKEYCKLISRIAWNIWQMDGLTGLPPYKAQKNDFTQISFLPTEENMNGDQEKACEPCLIYNWRSKKKEQFKTM